MPLLGRKRATKTYVGNPNVPAALTAAAAALTAAGFKIQRADADTMRRLIMPWQSRSFAYYDLLGEIKYASQFYSRSLASLRLYPGYINDSGDIDEIDGEEQHGSNDELAVRHLARIRDPGGGDRSSLQAAYGRLMFLAGECYLFVTVDEETGQEQWEMLSTDELRVTGSTYVRYRAPSVSAEEFQAPSDDDYEPVDDDSAVAYRLWKRHPRYSLMADATMQGVLDLCEELLLLTQAVRARARSRLAGSGILFLSDDLSMPALEAGVGEEDPEEDLFLSELTQAMLAPISNEGAASAVVPLIVRGATDAIEKGVRHLQIVDPTQLYPETGLRRECIERIAIGLDMPATELTGIADANHWTGWLVDEQSWKAHLQPISMQLVADLTGAYFQPQLRQDGVEDWQRYVIAYDASAVINHPDRMKDAKDLYDRRIVGKQAVRDAGGFDETDEMTEEELNESVGIALRDGSYVKYGIPSVKAGGVEPEAGEIVSGQGETSGPTDGTPGGVQPSTPATQPEEPPAEAVIGAGNGHSNGSADVLAARVSGAADLALHRAREQAGNRLRTKARRDPVLATLIDGVPAGRVAFVLGPDRVASLRVDPTQLVAGASDMLVEAFRMWGIRDPDAAELVGSRVEQHAARTLFEERPSLPPAFQNWLVGMEAIRR